MADFTVYKLDENGKEVWNYPAVVLERTERFVRLEAFFNRDDYDAGYVVFKRDDRFVEYFYTDRYYNIFAIYDRDDGELKGWYCNVCRPALITETAVRCDDLALDVWVDVDGTAVVLDEDEFEALELSADEKQKGLDATVELLALANKQQLPV
ncbi:MAG: DUF402 domain-containing protein [Chloroflexota bacterium]